MSGPLRTPIRLITGLPIDLGMRVNENRQSRNFSFSYLFKRLMRSFLYRNN